jgi:hypothetical protein
MVKAYEPDDGPTQGTWEWVIHRWKMDPHSRYNTCGPATREDYDYRTGKWAAIIGAMQIEDLGYDHLGIILTTMRDRKYSDSLVSKLFVMLRHLARYAHGPLRQKKQAGPVVEDLALIRIKSAKPRSVSPTPEQIRSIIDEADARGLFAFATGILFQWTYALRAVDVRGQWFKADPDQGGIIREKRGTGQFIRWQDGLTWDAFTPDLTHFSKTTSKTKAELTNIALTDELRGRLRLLRNAGNGTGPVITSEGSREPYTKRTWAQAWQRIREGLGLPDEIKMMDTRAGAITDARSRGADPFTLRDFATHTHVSTTDGYVRERSEAMNNVVKMRREK